MVSGYSLYAWKIFSRSFSILWLCCHFLQPAVYNSYNVLQVPVQLKSGEVRPGDLIISKMYGVGLYEGKVKGASSMQQQEHLLLIKYADSEVVLPESKENKKKLYCKGTAEHGQTLDSVFNTKKWDRALQASKDKAKGLAFSLIKLRAVRNKVYRTPYMINQAQFKEFEQAFKFNATEDQQTCFADIESDMVNSSIPMDRLICGDVGFGKTEVAMRAAYRAFLSGRQTVILAPTRTLASQHLRTFRERMPDVNVQPLRGNMGKDAKRVREMLADGTCDVVIGTQAVLSNTTTLKKPGLVIIDEEHRFGVLQKEQIKAASTHVDVLTLTATPIPRTLDIAMKEVMNVSYLHSPPRDRKAVNVSIHCKSGTDLLMDNIDVVTEAITREIKRNGQIFVVVPLIRLVDETEMFFRTLLDSQKMNNVSIMHAHGQCTDLVKRVEVFGQKNASILIATTVIENGIDMPNVNTILVLYADRFGLSTLHQLRGRVGRSDIQAYGYFIANQTQDVGADWYQRLEVIKENKELGAGFNISRADRVMRGSGNIFGVSQSGKGVDISFELAMDQLEEIVTELNYDVHLPIPNPLIQIDDLVEQLSNKHTSSKALPVTEGEIAQYEEQLIRNVFRTMIAQIEEAAVNVNIDAEVVDAMSFAEEDKILQKRDFWRKVFAIKEKSEMDKLLKHLGRRLLFRVCSKQAGISRIYIQDDTLRLSFTGLTERKWENIVRCNPQLRSLKSRIKRVSKSCTEMVLDAKMANTSDFYKLLQALAKAIEDTLKVFIEDPEEMAKYAEEKSQAKKEKELARTGQVYDDEGAGKGRIRKTPKPRFDDD